MNKDQPSSQIEFLPTSLLKKELSQLETEISVQKKKLKKTKSKLDRVKSSMVLTKQQIDIFTQETNRALEGFKDTNWQFTKELCAEITKIKKPNDALLNLAEKFLLMIEQKDRTWGTFIAVTRNFTPLKSLMSNLQPQLLSDEQVSELLVVWKNKQSIQNALQKYCKGIRILSDWIIYSVEYKLKKETLNSLELKYPEVSFSQLVDAKAELCSKISEINSLLLISEERVSEIKLTLDSLELQIEENNSEIKFLQDDRTIVTTPLHQGTASGGILQRTASFTPRFPRQFFPNFDLNSEDLYVEAPTKKVTEEEVKSIQYDDATEYVGCCRIKFFCF